MNNANTGEGYLQVKVYKARGAFPVEDATVRIFGDEEGKSTGILYTLTTDSSGLTEVVSLSAPARELSLSAFNKNPYSTYNVVITKEGFYPVEDINVPIFDGITSVQPVNLIPVSEFSENSPYPGENQEFIETPPPNL